MKNCTFIATILFSSWVSIPQKVTAQSDFFSADSLILNSKTALVNEKIKKVIIKETIHNSNPGLHGSALIPEMEEYYHDFDFDVKGRLTHSSDSGRAYGPYEIKYTFNDSDFMILKEYFENGQKTMYYKISSFENGGTETVFYRHIYPETKTTRRIVRLQGYTIEVKDSNFIMSNRQWILKQVVQYIYQTEGKIVEMNYCSLSDQKEVCSSTSYSYYADGHLKMGIRHNTDPANEIRTSYTYSDNFKTVTRTRNTSLSKLIDNIIFTYDNDFRVTKIQKYIPEDYSAAISKIVLSEEITVKYNALSGLPEEVQERLSNGIDGSLSIIKYEYTKFPE